MKRKKKYILNTVQESARKHPGATHFSKKLILCPDSDPQHNKTNVLLGRSAAETDERRTYACPNLSVVTGHDTNDITPLHLSFLSVSC